MGEVIRIIKEVSLSGGKFMIELNHGTEKNGLRDIHIQNEKFRLSVPETEFLQMASCVLLARRQLELIKGKDNLAEVMKRRG
ncbi:MAG: hypothetical protein E7249_17905 [Paenibacillaceae bacterium]|nr:hypothetical protein [Paenibacillaceae bacterium]